MPETIRINSTHPETQGDFVIINKDDFDADKHEMFDADVHEAPDPVDATADDESSDAEVAPARRGRKPKAE